jgi:hypothetical protein
MRRQREKQRGRRREGLAAVCETTAVENKEKEEPYQEGEGRRRGIAATTGGLAAAVAVGLLDIIPALFFGDAVVRLDGLVARLRAGVGFFAALGIDLFGRTLKGRWGLLADALFTSEGVGAGDTQTRVILASAISTDATA